MGGGDADKMNAFRPTELLLGCVNDYILKKYSTSVVPIYGVNEGGMPDKIGSGVLIYLSEGKFLVTAAHVAIWSNRTRLYIGTSDDEKFLELPNAFVNSTPEPHGGFGLNDIAFFLLDFIATSYADDRYIPESALSEKPDSCSGFVISCVGYPNSKNKFKHFKGSKLTAHSYILTDLSMAKPKDLNDIPGVPVVFMNYPKRVINFEGGHESEIALEGMSGGAMFEYEIGASLRFNPDNLKLAAVLIEARKISAINRGDQDFTCHPDDQADAGGISLDKRVGPLTSTSRS